MKNKILILLVSILLFTGCQTKKEIKKTDALKFKEEYESINGKMNEHSKKENRKLNIPEKNPMKYSNAKEIVNKMNNKETFLVYFGFNSCPWCRSVIETLIDVADDQGLDTIYYVDVLNIRDMKKVDEDGNVKTEKEGSKDYYKLLELMDNVLSDYKLDNDIDAGEKRIYAPNIVSVVNGKATTLTEGTSKDLTDPYMKLTDKMLTDSYKMIKCSVKCIVEENTCTKESSC